MPKIPFSSRRYGRYYFRRRVRLLDGKDIHVIVPLSTCDGQEARERVAILSAQFDRVRRTVNAYFEQNQTPDGDTIKALFETELRDCLSNLIMEAFIHAGPDTIIVPDDELVVSGKIKDLERFSAI